MHTSSRSLYETRIPVFRQVQHRRKWVSSVYRSNHETQDPRSLDREMIIGKCIARTGQLPLNFPPLPKLSRLFGPNELNVRLGRGILMSCVQGWVEMLASHSSNTSCAAMFWTVASIFFIPFFVLFVYRYCPSFESFVINFNNIIYSGLICRINVTSRRWS